MEIDDYFIKQLAALLKDTVTPAQRRDALYRIGNFCHGRELSQSEEVEMLYEIIRRLLMSQTKQVQELLTCLQVSVKIFADLIAERGGLFEEIPHEKEQNTPPMSGWEMEAYQFGVMHGEEEEEECEEETLWMFLDDLGFSEFQGLNHKFLTGQSATVTAHMEKAVSFYHTGFQIGRRIRSEPPKEARIMIGVDGGPFEVVPDGNAD